MINGLVFSYQLSAISFQQRINFECMIDKDRLS